MDNNRDSSLFLKLMEQKCTNIKTSIDSLLVDICSQLSHSNNQDLQEQVCNPHRNNAILESDLAEQACQTEIGNINHIDSDHIKKHRNAPWNGLGDFETGRKCFDRNSSAVEKEAVLNYSSDDQQYENAHLQFQPVDDQSINLSLEKIQARPHIKENDLVNIDTHNNLIVQNIQNDRNQDLLEFTKKFESYDEDLIKNYRGAIKDKIRNLKNNDYREAINDKLRNNYKDIQESNEDNIRNNYEDIQESNEDIIKEYQKAYKDQIKNQKKDYQEANKDKLKEQREANKDKLRNQAKDYIKANKDQFRNQAKDYREANKDKIKDYQKANKDKLRNQANREAKKDQLKDYQKANKDKIKDYREANKDQIKDYQKANKDKIKNKNKDYRVANQDQIKNKLKDYREANQDQIKNKLKDYQQANKDKIINRNKDYQQANKDKIKNKNNENRKIEYLKN